MSSFDRSLVDPTDKPADGLLIKAVGGRTGPLALENGATLTFPWSPQRRLSGSIPATIYVDDASDAVYGAHEAFRLLSPLLDSGTTQRAEVRLTGYYASAAGDHPVVEITGGDNLPQAMLRVGNPYGSAAQRILIESYPNGGKSGGIEGFVSLGGNIIAYAEDKTTPPVALTHDAQIPLLVRGRTFSSGLYSNNGNATAIGHRWIQGLDYGGSAWSPAKLTINPYGGDVDLGKAGVTTPVKVIETGTANLPPALGTGAVHPFRIGSAVISASDYQLAFTGRGIQALSNGVGVPLYLNPGGGAVYIGATDVALGWTSYTPTLIQSVAVTKTVTYAKYTKIGRTVHAQVHLAITAGTPGTASNAVFVGLPFAPAQGGIVTGLMYIYDASAATNYVGATVNSGTAVYAAAHNSGGALGAAGGFTAGLATSDAVFIDVTYEAST